VLAFLLFAASGRANPFENWTMRNPLPTGDRIQAVASGNGQFVAVGDDGTIVTSTDAANWVERQTTTDPLWAIVHDNGEFVAGWAGVAPS
jgi:hypothetical protein